MPHIYLQVLLVGNMGLYDYRPYVKRIKNDRQIIFVCDKGFKLKIGLFLSPLCSRLSKCSLLYAKKIMFYHKKHFLLEYIYIYIYKKRFLQMFFIHFFVQLFSDFICVPKTNCFYKVCSAPHNLYSYQTEM